MPVLRDCTFALFHNLEFMKRKQVTVSPRFIVHLTLFYFARLTRNPRRRKARPVCMRVPRPGPVPLTLTLSRQPVPLRRRCRRSSRLAPSAPAVSVY